MLVKQALANGGQVTAYARNSAKLAPYHERLTISKQAVGDAEAVIGPLGPLPGSKGLRLEGYFCSDWRHESG